MANVTDNAMANDAAAQFNAVVDDLVMKNLVKGVNLGSQGITVASENATNSVPNLGGGLDKGGIA